MLGSHVLPRRQTFHQTRRLASVRRTLHQIKRTMGIVVLQKVDTDPPMCLTSFGDDSTKPPAFPCTVDVMVDKGAAAPKLCFLPVEMRTPAATGGLLPAGTASIARMAIFPRLFFSWSLGEEIKKEPAGHTTTSLPLPAKGRLFKGNRGKLWCLILAVVQAVHAVARLWEGGTRCVVDGLVWTLHY